MNRQGAKSGFLSVLLRRLGRHTLTRCFPARTGRLGFPRQLASLLCLITAYAISGGTSARGIVIRDDQPDQSYLDLGASPDYASVGTFANVLTGCGTLIAPDWVVTAAHLIIAGSSSFTINGTTYAADQVIKYPQYVYGQEIQGYDIALAHLTTPVSGVTPATVYSASLEPVPVMTFVGFGMTGTGLTGQTKADFTKRACQNVADGDFGNPTFLLGSDFDNPHSAAGNVFGSPTPLTLEGCVANGDSGGGVFYTVGSQTYLAGVISFVASSHGSPNSSYGNVMGFGNLSSYNDWINSKIPEPSTFGLTGLGAACMLFVRRTLARRPRS